MQLVPRAIVGAEVAIAFTTIAFFILAARLYARYVLVKNPGREELAIIFAWVCLRSACQFLHLLSFNYEPRLQYGQLALRVATSNT